MESWESLRMHMEQREEELRAAKGRYMFLNTVRYTHSTLKLNYLVDNSKTVENIGLKPFLDHFKLLYSPGTGLLPLVLAGAEWDEGRGIHPRCCHLRFAVVPTPAAMG